MKLACLKLIFRCYRSGGISEELVHSGVSDPTGCMLQNIEAMVVRHSISSKEARSLDFMWNILILFWSIFKGKGKAQSNKDPPISQTWSMDH